MDGQYGQQQQQTTVIINQPGGGGQGHCAPQNVREWSTGLCGCFEDICSCCYAYFCWQCFMCSLAKQVGECYSGPFFCHNIFVSSMRTKVRTMYGIQGSICNDICCTAVCQFCIATQMSRELKNQGHGSII